MISKINFSCPRTGTTLIFSDGFWINSTDETIAYPVVNDIPILIDETNSLFRHVDFINLNSTTFDLNESQINKVIKRLMPKITNNIVAKRNFSKLAEKLPSGANVLVVGGSIIGQGMSSFYMDSRLNIMGADVSFGPKTDVICDGHNLPFPKETFDAVVIQAVLEHVLDPYRVVNEVYRVLKPEGYVYAETPFIQQVHMKEYDFTRFTHLGHRRLFRNFTEIDSGPAGGPGMALSWSWTWFLRSFSEKKILVFFLTFCGYITSFFLKYFDYYLVNKPGAYDAASFFFFWGQKSQHTLTDNELIEKFKGITHKF